MSGEPGALWLLRCRQIRSLSASGQELTSRADHLFRLAQHQCVKDRPAPVGVGLAGVQDHEQEVCAFAHGDDLAPAACSTHGLRR